MFRTKPTLRELHALERSYIQHPMVLRIMVMLNNRTLNFHHLVRWLTPRILSSLSAWKFTQDTYTQGHIALRFIPHAESDSGIFRQMP